MIGLTTIEKITNTTSFTNYIIRNEKANDILKEYFATDITLFYENVASDEAAIFFLMNMDFVFEHMSTYGILSIISKVSATAMRYLNTYGANCWFLKRCEELFARLGNNMQLLIPAVYGLRNYDQIPRDFYRLWGRDNLDYIPEMLHKWPNTNAECQQYISKFYDESKKVPSLGEVPIDVLRDWMVHDQERILTLLRNGVLQLPKALYHISVKDQSVENLQSCVLAYRTIIGDSPTIASKDTFESIIEKFMFKDRSGYMGAYELAKVLAVLKPLGLGHIVDSVVTRTMTKTLINDLYHQTHRERLLIPVVRSWPYGCMTRDVALYAYSAFIVQMSTTVKPQYIASTGKCFNHKQMVDLWENIDVMTPAALTGIPFTILLRLLNVVPFEKKVLRRDVLLRTLSTFNLNVVL